MDKEELQKNIALYYSKLPPKLQEMFSGMSWLETLKTISSKYNLTEDQIQTLGTETTLVLLGIIHPDEYEKKLRAEIVLSKDSIDKMLLEINSSVLAAIRPSLTETFSKNTIPQTPEEQEIGQELDARLEKLPENIKDIISQSNYQTALYGIAKDYKLNVIQMGILETKVIDLVLGNLHPDEFADSLETGLGLPKEKISMLVKDINEKIFLKIRELLKLMNTPAGEEPVVEEEEFSPLLVEEGAGGGDSSRTPPRPSGTPPQKGGEKNKTTEILNKAGISLVELPAGINQNDVKPTEKREDILAKIEKPELHPILAQKLSGFSKNPVVETDHSLHNLSSNKTVPTAPEVNKIPKVDPYREIPE